jgi:DNA-binding transcriptional regulator YiaG
MRKRTLFAKDNPPTAQELVAWRRQHGLTQRQAADWLGIPIKTYQNWEQSHRVMKYPVTIRRLMDAVRRRRRA